MTRVAVHPSALAWARRLSGERGGLAGWRFRRHLARCDACRAKEAELVRERAAFDGSPRRGDDLSRLRRAAEAGRAAEGIRWRPLVALLAAAGASAALLFAFLPAGRPELSAKGRSHFAVFVDRPEGAVPLPFRCRPGDRLMARYRTTRPYLLLLERDGQERVQVLFPQDGATSARLPAGEGTTPVSWVLDAVPGRECFAAFFSDAPVDAATARRALLDPPGAPTTAGAEVLLRCCDKVGAP